MQAIRFQGNQEQAPVYGAAFQGQTNSGNFADNVITGKPNDDDEYKNFVWAIPVVVSVWF